MSFINKYNFKLSDFAIKENINVLSILLFLMLYIIIIIVKPDFIFHEDGSLRDFGIGYIKKTILPIWLIAIILAILSYFIISFVAFS
tara:strand:- start:3465 stop:3725 length:261 start_codon:yes stop_codon:yes gene_type:complete